jgi:hypothetical protein
VVEAAVEAVEAVEWAAVAAEWAAVVMPVWVAVEAPSAR